MGTRGGGGWSNDAKIDDGRENTCPRIRLSISLPPPPSPLVRRTAILYNPITHLYSFSSSAYFSLYSIRELLMAPGLFWFLDERMTRIGVYDNN